MAGQGHGVGAAGHVDRVGHARARAAAGAWVCGVAEEGAGETLGGAADCGLEGGDGAWEAV